jgi:Galactose oxidase, central domain
MLGMASGQSGYLAERKSAGSRAIAPVVLVGVLLLASAVTVGFGGDIPGDLGQQAASAGSTLLESASATLAEGAGPASGAHWNCAPAGSGAYSTCQSGASAPPAIYAGTPTTSPDWTQLNTTPSDRSFVALAYDAEDNEIVLFGGTNLTTGALLADTWVFTTAWSELNLSVHPGARYSAVFAYDYKDHYLVLFGGIGSSGATYLNDTWEFVHGTWTQLSTTTAPPGGSNSAMTWDPTDSYLLFFGGVQKTGVVDSQTWKFVGGVWTKITTTTSPSARQGAQIAYDSSSHSVILYGGENGTGTALSTQWNFSKGLWTQQHPSKTPGPRVFGAMTNDSTDGYIVLFGGSTGSGVAAPDTTWTYSNGSWAKVTPATPPPAELFASLVYSKQLGEAFLFGGDTLSRGPTNFGVWTYHADVWAHLGASRPTTPFYAAMTYDEAAGYVLLFGGTTSTKFSGSNATWTYSHDLWTRLALTVAPPPMYGTAMTYDAADAYVLLFGGFDPLTSALQNQTWSFSGGHWKNLHASGPEARSFEGLAYDAYDGYVVMFGGYGYVPGLAGNSGLNDTWTYSGGVWTLVVPEDCTSCGPQPAGRDAPEMTYDAADGVILLYGGFDWVNFLYESDTWQFAAGTWANETPNVSPGPAGQAFGSITYDGADGYALLYGGIGTHGYSSQTWNYSALTGWSEMYPANNPGIDFGGSMAFDAKDSSVVYLTGGLGPDQTWLY